MSYLNLLKQAAARRLAERTGDETNELTNCLQQPAIQTRETQPGYETTEVAFLAMDWPEFAATGAQLEVRVPWSATTIWFVPTDRDVAHLLAEGVTRGRIWTAEELAAVRADSESWEALKPIIMAKLVLEGEITEVKGPAGTTDWFHSGSTVVPGAGADEVVF